MYKQVAAEPSLRQRYFEIFLVVSAYWIISISTVFVNKALFDGSVVNLNCPLFVTWFQCMLSTLICFVMSTLSKIFPEKVTFPNGSPISFYMCKKVLPLSILFTVAVGSNNLCLKYVGVAFYYIGRSLTTVFNVIFSLILLGEKTSLKCVLCCASIIFGFWLGVDQESLTESFSLKGTILGVIGSLSLALYTIYTKKVLPIVNQEIWLLSYYNNFYSSILFIPLIIINGELPKIINYEHLGESWFWSVMLVGGLCGFSIGIITVLQIKVTSPLTHNISGTAKACAQTIIATQWYEETKSFLWWFSNFVILLGSATYARIKQVEMADVKHKNRSTEKV